jgi:hypothetical protein
MSRAELDLAITRIELPRTAAGAMPPSQFRQLAQKSGCASSSFLRNGARAGEVDPTLQHASKLGMQGLRMRQ